jgi:hypothetical protein
MSQLGFDASGIFNKIVGGAGGQLVFRSQLTPEIVIDLANLATPKPSPQAITSSDRAALRFIRPEVIIRGLGVEKSVAPYGKPSPHFYLNILIASAAVGLIGGGLAWKICKSA